MAVEDVINEAKERLESMLAPIDGGAGADVSYDETFDLIKNEIEKMQSVTGGKVDWSGITMNAEEILSDKGKDFRVAVYYATARAHTDGIQGLFEGFVLIEALDEAFWDKMGPPIRRPKARGNIFGWFTEQVAGLFQSYQPTAKETDLIKALEKVTRSVDVDLADKLGDSHSGLGQLSGVVRNLVLSLPKEAPPPPPPPPPPPTPPPPPPEAAAPAAAPAVYTPQVAEVATYAPEPTTTVVEGLSPASITDADSAMTAVGECALILARIGEAIRAEDHTSALAYRFARAGIWLELNRNPPTPNDDGMTLVPSPSDSLRENFESLAAAEDWVGLINAVEAATAESPLWLDPQRYGALAMDRLGEPYFDAKDALLREVAYMIVRAPAMPTLRFNDGVPFADEETQAWINAEVKSILGSGGGGGGRVSRNPIDAAIEKANGLVAEGQLIEAIEGLKKAGNAVSTPIDKFRARLAVAKLCNQSEQYAVARAQLDGLERLVEQHRLMEWDPALCAELYGALYIAHRGANMYMGDALPPEVRARETLAFERLCQLDAALAIKLVAG